MDLAEVVHDEVEQRGAGSHWSIVLSGLADFHFGHFGLPDLLGKEVVSVVQSSQGSLRTSLHEYMCVRGGWTDCDGGGG